MSAVLEAVHAHVRAFNAQDLDAVVATFAEDAVLASGDQLVVGGRALRRMFAEAFDAPVDAALELRHAVVDADVAACELTETLTVEGALHTLDVAAFYTVRDGKLARARIYRDLAGA